MRVLVAGGGIAALEVLAGLRALAGERVTSTLVAPVTSFSFRPLSTAMPFTLRRERSRELAELAGGLGASFVHDGLTQVDESRGRVLTARRRLSRLRRARSRGRGPNAPRRGHRPDVDARAGRHLALHARAPGPGERRRSERGFCHSARGGMAGRRLRAGIRGAPGGHSRECGSEGAATDGRGNAPRSLRPGRRGGRCEELTRAGIELVTGVEACESGAGDDAGDEGLVLQLTPGSPLRVDRAVFLPVVDGPAIAGVSHDSRGFIPVDAHARVAGAHGAASPPGTPRRSRSSTAPSRPARRTPRPRRSRPRPARMSRPPRGLPCCTGCSPCRRISPAERGSPWLEGGEPMTHCLWWPPGHAAGRHLAPYLAASDPGVRPGLEWHPNGLPVAVEVGGADQAAAWPPPGRSDR